MSVDIARLRPGTIERIRDFIEQAKKLTNVYAVMIIGGALYFLRHERGEYNDVDIVLSCDVNNKIRAWSGQMRESMGGRQSSRDYIDPIFIQRFITKEEAQEFVRIMFHGKKGYLFTTTLPLSVLFSIVDSEPLPNQITHLPEGESNGSRIKDYLRLSLEEHLGKENFDREFDKWKHKSK